MKDLVKTGIVVGIIIIAILFVYGILGNLHYGVELFTRTNLSLNDPTIGILMERIEANKYLRRAKLLNTDLSSDDIIKFTLDNLTENDYTKTVVESIKIVCTVNDRVKFNSSNPVCTFMVIDNKTFMDYQKKYFNTETELQFDEIKYHGYHCKNDGNRYYCMHSTFNDSILEYSAFENAYEEKDKIVLRGYYLRIDAKDRERCLHYFNETYCDNYLSSTKPTLSDDVISSDGVLYEHVFKKNDVSYYLEKSYIVSEG